MTFTAEGEKDMDDKLIIGGREFTSRFILGSGKFSLNMTKIVIENAGVDGDLGHQTCQCRWRGEHP